MPEEKEEKGKIGADTENDSIKAISKDINALTTMTSENLANTSKQFAEMKATLVNHKTLIDDLAAKAKPVGISLPGVELEKEKFSFMRAVYAMVHKDWSAAGFEKEVFANTRAMATTTGAGGGYLVPDQISNEMIELLRAESVVMAAGATVYSGLQGGQYKISKQTGGAVAYWTAEAASITASDASFGELTLTPHALTGRCILSNEVMQHSTPSIEAIMRRDLTEARALTLDLAALRGTGTSNQPIGIVNTEGISTVAIGADGGDFTFDHAAAMEGTLEDANALKGALGFIMHGKVKRKLKSEKTLQFSGDTKGAYIMLPMSDNKLKEYLGYNFGISSQMPTNLTKGSGTSLAEVIFGNFRDLIIAEWGSFEIAASSETSDAFERNQTHIRIIQHVDIGIRHPESFCLINDAATT